VANRRRRIRRGRQIRDSPRATDDAAYARCTFEGGDFFDAVPPGGDLYIVKKVIHDWDDARALRMLSNIRHVMQASGTLLVIEPVVPTGNGPSFTKLLDLLMLVWTAGGRERTEDEHRQLLKSAGFRVEDVAGTNAEIQLIEARAA
jgi:hypothetical protein